MTQSSANLWKPDLSRRQCLTVEALLLSLIAVMSGASGLPVKSLGQFLLTVHSHHWSFLLYTAQFQPFGWRLLTTLITLQIHPFISTTDYPARGVMGHTGAYPSCLYLNAGLHSRFAVSSFLFNIEAKNQTHSYSHPRTIKVNKPARCRVSKLWTSWTESMQKQRKCEPHTERPDMESNLQPFLLWGGDCSHCTTVQP